MLKFIASFFYIIIIAILEASAGRKSDTTTTTTASPFSNILNYHVHTFKYNRTATAVNTTIFAKMEVGYGIEVIVQAYRFASNEYRMFPMHLQFNLCEAISTKAAGYDQFSVKGNFSCPILKGKRYQFYNWSPEETRFPPFIPTGRYMLELQFEYNSHEILLTREYGSVYRPIVID